MKQDIQHTAVCEWTDMSNTLHTVLVGKEQQKYENSSTKNGSELNTHWFNNVVIDTGSNPWYKT